jgi:hypothetical protein
LAKVAGELAADPPSVPAIVAISLAILAISGLAVGVQALFFPESFYEDFPFGRGWVALDPPYNEHLVRDVGGLQLGLGLIAAWAYLTRRAVLARAAGIGWLAFGVPHAAYHLAHLGAATGADRVGLAMGTVGPALLALVVTVWPMRRAGRGQTHTVLERNQAAVV